MENFLVNSFTTQQKLSAITLIRIIINVGQDQNKILTQDKVINNQATTFGLNSNECEVFFNSINPSNLQNQFISLNNEQKDYLVAMVYEILLSGGTPSERDFIVAENLFDKVANINPDEFIMRIEKIQALGNYFTK